VEKRELVDTLLEELRGRHAALVRAANDAREGATDSENRQESKYDTRGLEASYLAAGQAQKAEELVGAIAAVDAMTVRDFGPGDRISAGALVTVTAGADIFCYLLVPAGGGLEIIVGDDEVTTLNLSAPMGKLLTGKKVGDVVPTGEQTPSSKIVSMS